MGAENVNWTVLIAASVLSIIPLVLVFIVFQRYILDSDATTGMKD